MRYLILSALFLSALGTTFAQNHQSPYSSLGGYGNVLYPGTGHAPPHPPGGITGPNYSGRTFGPGHGFNGPGPVDHPQHRRSNVVLYPVFYGGYNGYDPSYYGDQQQPPVDPNAPPSVVINQTFVPQQANPVVREYPEGAPLEEQSGMRVYQNPSHPYEEEAQNPASARRSADDDQPTLYLIAFKDHSIVQALGYWMEGGSLHYVSVEHTLNQVSMNLLDRDLSQRLNDERGVPFKLPAR